ncbi:MAG: hypothetical protein V7L23_01260 [Nostoc sp.]|uniref:hypothetical protein n=1 Tax=Nostoc sp. TaxID=1180 RepID=UPI002FF2A977
MSHGASGQGIMIIQCPMPNAPQECRVMSAEWGISFLYSGLGTRNCFAQCPSLT